MNLPNKLTMARVIIIPLFCLIFLLNPDSKANLIWADAFFIAACITDFLDGYIARRCNLVTNFGKFMDPLADKVLVCSAMLLLISVNRLNVVAGIIIIAREFIISGFRLVASDNGRVIAASYWGKFKTTFQMIMIIILLTNPVTTFWVVVANIFVFLAVAFTLISLVDYVYKNIDVLKESK